MVKAISKEVADLCRTGAFEFIPQVPEGRKASEGAAAGRSSEDEEPRRSGDGGQGESHTLPPRRMART